MEIKTLDQRLSGVVIDNFKEISCCEWKKDAESWNELRCRLPYDFKTYQVSDIFLILYRILFTFSISRPHFF